ncbi:MAG: metal-dependent transcriptional regulator [Spirochaetes bacterium]|nr:metal-dependent transcriptional regulator [Spirochaetota bacterium]
MKLKDAREDGFFNNSGLSAHMEDYLETISMLAQKKRVVRVKDIAKKLNVKMPSVTVALQKLKELGLISYEKYGFVELTDEGEKIAKRVYSRHSCLADFFENVLRISKVEADSEACKVEHHLSPQSCRQLKRLVDFVNSSETDGKWKDDLFAKMDERQLCELKEGDRAVIVRIDAQGELKKRLLELGFKKGEQVELIRYAPLEDPLQVKIKRYNVSLRIDEAKTITVMPVKKLESNANR